MTKNTDGFGSTKVRKSHVEYVTIYEVTENELSILENGTKSGVFLDIGIFLLSMALTSIGTLVSSTFTKAWYFDLFLLLSIVGVIGGAILLIVWKVNKKSTSEVVKVIKSRLKED